MMRFFSQMIRLPITAFVYSMEMFVKTMQGLQRMTNQSIDDLAEGVTQTLSQRLPDESAGNGNQINQKEDDNMSDQDLSGDDLKYVSYSILFTKRDLEATLEEEQQDLVSYSTNGGSYGGLKIAHFMKRVLDGKVKRPELWKENKYPPNAIDETHWTIPTEDERYITFIYWVDRRLHREGKEYDREQVKELRGIKEGIETVGKKMRP